MKTTTVLLLSALSLSSFAGIKKRFAQEFKNDGNKIINMIEREDINVPAIIKDLDRYTLNLDIQLAKVEFKRGELKDKFGRVKCAVNYPYKRLIKVNIDCWKKIRGNKELRLPFVFHEYLGLSNQEVDHYQISSKLVSVVKEAEKVDAEIKRKAQEKRNAEWEKQREKERIAAEKKKAKEKKKAEEKKKKAEEKKIKDAKRLKDALKNATYSHDKYEVSIPFNNVLTFHGIKIQNISGFIKTYSSRESNAMDEFTPSYLRDKICQQFGYSYSSGFTTEKTHNYVENSLKYYYGLETVTNAKNIRKEKVTSIECYRPIIK